MWDTAEYFDSSLRLGSHETWQDLAMGALDLTTWSVTGQEQISVG